MHFAARENDTVVLASLLEAGANIEAAASVVSNTLFVCVEAPCVRGLNVGKELWAYVRACRTLVKRLFILHLGAATSPSFPR